jgi:hypothetical protein
MAHTTFVLRLLTPARVATPLIVEVLILLVYQNAIGKTAMPTISLGTLVDLKPNTAA